MTDWTPDTAAKARAMMATLKVMLNPEDGADWWRHMDDAEKASFAETLSDYLEAALDEIARLEKEDK